LQPGIACQVWRLREKHSGVFLLLPLNDKHEARCGVNLPKRCHANGEQPASTQRPDKDLAGLTLANLVPVPVSQARVAQSLDEGQVLLEALQFAPQVGQHLSCRPSHGLSNLGCLPIPATPYLHLIPVLLLQAGHIQAGMLNPKCVLYTKFLSFAWWCSQSAESYLALSPETL